MGSRDTTRRCRCRIRSSQGTAPAPFRPRQTGSRPVDGFEGRKLPRRTTWQGLRKLCRSKKKSQAVELGPVLRRHRSSQGSHVRCHELLSRTAERPLWWFFFGAGKVGSNLMHQTTRSKYLAKPSLHSAPVMVMLSPRSKLLASHCKVRPALITFFLNCSACNAARTLLRPSQGPSWT